jgi:hypothetical protein
MNPGFTRRFDIDEPESFAGTARGRTISEDLLSFEAAPVEQTLIDVIRVSPTPIYGARLSFSHVGLFSKIRTFVSTLAWESGIRFYEPADSWDYVISVAESTAEDVESIRMRGFIDVPAPVRVIRRQDVRLVTSGLQRWAPQIILDRRATDAVEQ